MTDDHEHEVAPVTAPDAVEAPARRGLWRRIAGDANHVGFWTLPVFVMTALGGAIIAGVIANVYYAQQVASLEEETRAARTAAEVAAGEIDAAREEALSAIDEQVDAVREQLEAARPLEDPATAGVVALVVELAPPAPEPAAEPAPAAPSTPAPAADGQVDGALVTSGTEQPTSAPPPGATPAGSGSNGPPAAAPGAVLRNGVGFVVAVADGDAYIATSYGVIDDPRSPDGVAPAVTVTSNTGSARGVVHAWDRARHVAILRVPIGSLPILPWRPSTVPVQPGDVTVLAAVTPNLVGLQLPGRIGAITPDALVTDLPMDAAFDGAPVLDRLGRVVGLQASTATPFGSSGGSVIPAAQLCVELVSGCELLAQPDASDS